VYIERVKSGIIMRNFGKIGLMLVVVLLAACSGNGQNKPAEPKKEEAKAMENKLEINRTEEEWKKILTPEQYYVLREKGTDSPFSGKFYLHKEEGMYSCAACGNELFSSDMKFASNCGWPSFDRELAGGKIKQVRDTTHGMIRIEILCAKCGSHLGHIFDDGPTVTGQRYCVNSTSIAFEPEKK
jgi:peptide-methionine (R)-S-oxide reductase